MLYSREKLRGNGSERAREREKSNSSLVIQERSVSSIPESRSIPENPSSPPPLPESQMLPSENSRSARGVRPSRQARRGGSKDGLCGGSTRPSLPPPLTVGRDIPLFPFLACRSLHRASRCLLSPGCIAPRHVYGNLDPSNGQLY